MRVAVAGATGVLGRALVPKLIEAGHQPVALARDTAKAERLFGGMPVEIKHCDLLARGCNELTVAELIDGCQGVIHAATAIPADFNAPDAWVRNTLLRIRGTGRLERAGLAIGAEVFLCQSIIMAYPDGGDEWLDEKTPIDWSGERREVCQPVGIMESMIWLLRKHPSKMRWAILKGGIFVGPGTFEEQTIEQIRRGELVVPGDGSHYVSLVHVDDVANAFVMALERAPTHSVFNVCAEPLRYGDYVDALADSIGAAHPKRHLSVSRPVSHRASNRAAREVLGWEPKRAVVPACPEVLGKR